MRSILQCHFYNWVLSVIVPSVARSYEPLSLEASRVISMMISPWLYWINAAPIYSWMWQLADNSWSSAGGTPQLRELHECIPNSKGISIRCVGRKELVREQSWTVKERFPTNEWTSTWSILPPEGEKQFSIKLPAFTWHLVRVVGNHVQLATQTKWLQRVQM